MEVDDDKYEFQNYNITSFGYSKIISLTTTKLPAYMRESVHK
jgi:hypothetical protein